MKVNELFEARSAWEDQADDLEARCTFLSALELTRNVISTCDKLNVKYRYRTAANLSSFTGTRKDLETLIDAFWTREEFRQNVKKLIKPVDKRGKNEG